MSTIKTALASLLRTVATRASAWADTLDSRGGPGPVVK